jgi:hypothetical protein
VFRNASPSAQAAHDSRPSPGSYCSCSAQVVLPAVRQLADHHKTIHKSDRLANRRCGPAKREGMSRLIDLIATAEGEEITTKKTFRYQNPGFIHIDIKYLPQMSDEPSRHYLFVALDRLTRLVFKHIYDDMTDVSSVDFLRRLKSASPIKISKIVTENGSQFTNRSTIKDNNRAISMLSTSPAQPCLPSIGWHLRAIRKLTV